MATQSQFQQQTSIPDPDGNGYTWFLGLNTNKREVDLDEWVLSNESAQNNYNSLVDSGWGDDMALEYTHKIFNPATYDENLPEYDGSGINEHPEDGSPLTNQGLADLNAAKDNAIREDLKKQASEQDQEDLTDWRVRLHLPENSKHLYQADEPGILHPLYATRGVIFPYTPTINVQYNANYESYDLVHSNYRGYFYKGSTVQNIIIQATFTAQDTAEANYMLATMHFLRSCTKMFYGQDDERGMPPPVVMLTGFGEYQFKDHPCAITTVAYNLPNDVDYIAAGDTVEGVDPTSNFIIHKPNSKQATGKQARRNGANIGAGAEPIRRSSNNTNGPSQNANESLATKLYDGITYVPTKIDLNFTMIPIQTRDQVSNEFSLKDYATGKLLKKGFW